MYDLFNLNKYFLNTSRKVVFLLKYLPIKLINKSFQFLNSESYPKINWFRAINDEFLLS
jgi:hypothetical protein